LDLLNHPFQLGLSDLVALDYLESLGIHVDLFRLVGLVDLDNILNNVVDNGDD